MPYDRDTRLKASFIESHAAQVRADALAIMAELGPEYVDALSNCIADAMEESSVNKRLFGMLAEIGLCSVLTNEVDSDDEE